ncbi:hypothetical protein IEQ44_13120 [Nocardioides sp. Y6]|uniref:Signal transduction histidine kinase subgroup 3 dimerisation and phosphoacceptor domain-containing protein n=1 Tax=Nocardioides malaquae TaxID=2773426 RepID=A0ABR9RVQ0_9ACTN|nr:histidine kinase [Nocardioides malaquae]MBE7325593.1 hypothetical protein [Nocardioides malaquae]
MTSGGPLLGWAGRTNVQRIDLYTRGSLRGMALLLVGFAGLAAVSTATTRWEVVAIALHAVALVVVVDRCVTIFMRLWFSPGELPRLWLTALAVLLLVGVAWLAWGTSPDDRFTTSYLLTTTVALALGGARQKWVQGGAVVAGALLCGVSGSWMWLFGAGIAAFFVFTVQSSLWVLGVVHELDRARSAQADLAVAEERLRFSRDVHDVMGRHLATIAVQSELAATLAERGDPRAAARIREVRASAHDALREARALARGYRPVDLAQEVEGARALLVSAGIAVETDLADLPARWQEPVARLVREAVTNTLRHSRATQVRLDHADGVVTVRNDGVHAGHGGEGGDAPGDVEGDGSGLRTLAADVATHGGRLTWGVEHDEFVVRLHLHAPEEATP